MRHLFRDAMATSDTAVQPGHGQARLGPAAARRTGPIGHRALRRRARGRQPRHPAVERGLGRSHPRQPVHGLPEHPLGRRARGRRYGAAPLAPVPTKRERAPADGARSRCNSTGRAARPTSARAAAAAAPHKQASAPRRHDAITRAASSDVTQSATTTRGRARPSGFEPETWLLVPAEARTEAEVRRGPPDTRAKGPGVDGPERIPRGARK